MILTNRLSSFALAVVSFATLTIAVEPVRGESTPAITGKLSGVELCPQSVCGAATFVATFQGSVGPRPALGLFWAAVNHEPLPTVLDQTVLITGGKWNLSTGARSFRGRIDGGTLTCKDSDCLTFDVRAVLILIRGGSGEICGSGLLDHTEFPPTIEGSLLQDIGGCLP